MVNKVMQAELDAYTPRKEYEDFYQAFLSSEWKKQNGTLESDKKKLTEQIKEVDNKVFYLRKLLVSKQLDTEDFRTMKADYTEKLARL